MRVSDKNKKKTKVTIRNPWNVVGEAGLGATCRTAHDGEIVPTVVNLTTAALEGGCHKRASVRSHVKI